MLNLKEIIGTEDVPQRDEEWYSSETPECTPRPLEDVPFPPLDSIPPLREKKKRRAVWETSYRLAGVTFPRPTPDKVVKRYVLWLCYRQEGATRIRTKRIMFGTKGRSEYIDHLDENKKGIRIYDLSLQSRKDFFHPNFWICALLNNKETLEKSYVDFVQNIA